MTDKPIHLPACPGKKDVPSEKERECLLKMKAIKERVRELKVRAKSIGDLPDPDAREETRKVEEELRILKGQWDSWEKTRLEAERERMVLLGHLEPEEP